MHSSITRRTCAVGYFANELKTCPETIWNIASVIIKNLPFPSAVRSWKTKAFCRCNIVQICERGKRQDGTSNIYVHQSWRYFKNSHCLLRDSFIQTFAFDRPGRYEFATFPAEIHKNFWFFYKRDQYPFAVLTLPGRTCLLFECRWRMWQRLRGWSLCLGCCKNKPVRLLRPGLQKNRRDLHT